MSSGFFFNHATHKLHAKWVFWLCKIQVAIIPLTCCVDVSFRSHKSSKGWAAAGSKSFVYCRNPDVVVKQHLHIQEWYRKRPSSRYGCANASMTDILLSCSLSSILKLIRCYYCDVIGKMIYDSLPIHSTNSNILISVSINTHTGSNTNIWHNRWTASCVACELRV